MELFAVLAVPLALAALSLFVKNTKTTGILTAAGYGLVSLLAPSVARGVAGRPWSAGIFYVDSLGAYFMLVIAVITLASALYSIGYVESDRKEGVISDRKARLYYLLFNLFTFTMLFVTVLNNLGILWVAIEMTTLTSAFLVGFYNNKKAVEAAWKYVIICSVGITLALFGTILFYYTASVHGHVQSINWTDILAAAHRLDPKVLKMAFLFIVIGYGTKAGLAPMHTWLPDAHSQAPAPVSALLSGVLLKTSLYAIIRFMMIADKSLGHGYSGALLTMFGLVSLGIAAGFMLVQKDIKRLLAYSSIEHVGVITLGLGIGGPAGIFGALFHVFNHAATKSLMFFGAGSVVRKYGTHNMHVIRGVSRVLPFTGIVLLAGAFALGGSPPFSVFSSELIILVAGFKSGSYFTCAAFLISVAAVFGALLYHFGRVAFGRKPEGMAPGGEMTVDKAVLAALLVFIGVSGLWVPGFFNGLLENAARIINGL
ncbi:MAG: hydrogenase 4 subunit F [Endomicrobiales bacterium]